MQAFFVVALQLEVGDVTDLLKVLEHMRVQQFGAIGFVESFNVGVLVRLAWLDVAQQNQLTRHGAVYSGPLSQ